VEYTKKFTNRNRIKTPEGWRWLTIPVKCRDKSKIYEVGIDNTNPWGRTHFRTLQANYGKTLYFDDFKDFFEDVYSRKWTKLAELNMFIVKGLCEILGLKNKFFVASDLNVEGKSEELLIKIVKAVGGNEYFSGKSGKNYMNPENFKNADIKLTFQNIEYPEYRQRFGEFIPNLSFVDMLFNEGKENSLKILKKVA
jgi:hypothetical protein